VMAVVVVVSRHTGCHAFFSFFLYILRVKAYVDNVTL
jgi:hypothetical protein